MIFLLSLQSCQSGTPYQYGSQCYQVCPTPFVDSVNKLCLAACSYGTDFCVVNCAGATPNLEAGLCVPYCSDSTPLLKRIYADRSVFECVGQCNFVSEYSLECVDTCTGTAPGYKTVKLAAMNAKRCFQNCPSQMLDPLSLYLSVPECVISCPASRSLLSPQTGYYNCVTSCNFVQFSSSLYAYICQDLCATAFRITALDFIQVHECVTCTLVDRDSSVQYKSTARCVNYCPDSRPLQQLTNGVYQCVSYCVFSTADFKCIDTCSFTSGGYAVQWPSSTISVKVCFETCSGRFIDADPTVLVDGAGQCVAVCPVIRPFLTQRGAKFECTSSCYFTLQQSFDELPGSSFRVCGSCSAAFVLETYNGLESRLCYQSCPLAFHFYDSVLYIGSTQCLAECPAARPYSSPRAGYGFECVQKCSILASSGDVCELACSAPTDTFTSDIINGATAKRCNHNCLYLIDVQSTYLGLPECVATCPYSRAFVQVVNALPRCVSSCSFVTVPSYMCQISCAGATAGYQQVTYRGTTGNLCQQLCPNILSDSAYVMLGAELCVEQCPSARPFLKLRGTTNNIAAYSCFAACNFIYLKLSGKYYCQTTCNVNYPADVQGYQATSVNGVQSLQCFDYCPPTLKYYDWDTRLFNTPQCVAACPDARPLVTKVGQVYQCTAIASCAFFINDLVEPKVCVASCTGASPGFTIEQVTSGVTKAKCWATCPDAKPLYDYMDSAYPASSYQNTGMCVATCPSARPFKQLITGTTTYKCVSSCVFVKFNAPFDYTCSDTCGTATVDGWGYAVQNVQGVSSRVCQLCTSFLDRDISVLVVSSTWSAGQCIDACPNARLYKQLIQGTTVYQCTAGCNFVDSDMRCADDCLGITASYVIKSPIVGVNAKQCAQCSTMLDPSSSYAYTTQFLVAKTVYKCVDVCPSTLSLFQPVPGSTANTCVTSSATCDFVRVVDTAYICQIGCANTGYTEASVGSLTVKVCISTCPDGTYTDATQAYTTAPKCVSCAMNFIYAGQCVLTCAQTSHKYLVQTPKRCSACQIYVENSPTDRVCQTTCAPLLSYQMQSETLCVVSCPSDAPLVSSGSCVTNCPKFYTTVCVDLCGAAQFWVQLSVAVGAGSVVVRQCTDSCAQFGSTLLQYLSVPKCVADCADQFAEAVAVPPRLSPLCGTSCLSGNYIVSGAALVCLAASQTCAFYVSNSSMRQCYASCPAYYPYKMLDAPRYRCLVICPAFLDGDECVATCPMNMFLVDPITHFYVCQSTCAFTTTVSQFGVTTNLCLNSCAFPYELQIIATTECVSVDTVDARCVHRVAYTSVCRADCSQLTEVVSGVSHCVATCTVPRLILANSCVFSCGDMFKLNGVCRDSCSELDLFMNDGSCQANCPVLQKIGKCVDDCGLSKTINNYCQESCDGITSSNCKESITIVISSDTLQGPMLAYQTALIVVGSVINLVLLIAIIAVAKRRSLKVKEE